MTTSKLFVAAIAVSTALATPAFAQWRSQEPAAHEAQYPNGDRNLASPRDARYDGLRAFCEITAPHGDPRDQGSIAAIPLETLRVAELGPAMSRSGPMRAAS